MEGAQHHHHYRKEVVFDRKEGNVELVEHTSRARLMRHPYSTAPKIQSKDALCCARHKEEEEEEHDRAEELENEPAERFIWQSEGEDLIKTHPEELRVVTHEGHRYAPIIVQNNGHGGRKLTLRRALLFNFRDLADASKLQRRVDRGIPVVQRAEERALRVRKQEYKDMKGKLPEDAIIGSPVSYAEEQDESIKKEKAKEESDKKDIKEKEEKLEKKEKKEEKEKEKEKKERMKYEPCVKTGDKRTLREGVLYRGTGATYVGTEEDVQITLAFLTQELGIKTMLDLRSKEEIKPDVHNWLLKESFITAPNDWHRGSEYTDKMRRSKAFKRQLEDIRVPATELKQHSDEQSTSTSRTSRHVILMRSKEVREEIERKREIEESDVDVEAMRSETKNYPDRIGSYSKVEATSHHEQHHERMRIRYIINLVDGHLRMALIRSGPKTTFLKMLYHVKDMNRVIAIVGRELIEPLGLAGLYCIMLTSNPELYVNTMRLIADPSNHPISIQCTNGKDRSALICAMLLSCIGFSDDAVIADYCISESKLARCANAIRTENSLKGIATPTFNGTGADVMRDVLAFVKKEWGSVGGYLDKHGFTYAEQTALATLLYQ